MRIAIKFGYDGRLFHGYARQPTVPTVEGEILRFLIEKHLIDTAQCAMFRSASRTDKGVSALGNVISFNTDADAKSIMVKMQGLTPDIIVYGYALVDSDFNPRYAQMRQYRYFLKDEGVAWDTLLMDLEVFTGKHDFSNFARVESHRAPVRGIDSIIVHRCRGYGMIDFFAQHFLWHQIRRIISAVMLSNTSKISSDDLKNALNNPEVLVDFGVADPYMLMLKDVVYSFDFMCDKRLYKQVLDLERQIISSEILSHGR